jgi:hypothetical protein
MTLRYFITYLFLFHLVFAKGQSLPMDPTTFDYSKADSIALNFPKKKYNYCTELVAPLIQGLETDHEKFRVLFRWITDNIQYSYGNRSSDPDKVVKNKKAVCIGYASLLKAMCMSAGIECEIITGYAKTQVTDINKKCKKSNHAWNAVKLSGKWYLLDVTWATSYYDERKRKSIKCFDEFYYLTPPNIFVKNHLPDDKKWQLLNKTLTKSRFSKAPLYYGDLSKDVKILQPYNGTIKIKLKDTFKIRFTSNIELNDATIELGKNRFVYHPTIQKEEGSFYMNQKFEKVGLYKLTVFFNGQALASYNLEIKE